MKPIWEFAKFFTQKLIIAISPLHSRVGHLCLHLYDIGRAKWTYLSRGSLSQSFLSGSLFSFARFCGTNQRVCLVFYAHIWEPPCLSAATMRAGFFLFTVFVEEGTFLFVSCTVFGDLVIRVLWKVKFVI